MFIDRKDAGEKLAQALEKYRNQDVIVVGIPRGGVEVAYYVANHLNAELCAVIARKLGYPENPEAAFGAIAEDGSVYISDWASETMTKEEMNAVIEEEKQEIKRRVEKFRRGKPLPQMKGKTVIITDDGIATGATVFATIELCKNMGASRIVVAAPISGRSMEAVLRRKADEVVILEKPLLYQAVSQGYRRFYNLTDEETIAFLDQWKKEHDPI
jgi:putative phosphoribosyl transferase